MKHPDLIEKLLSYASVCKQQQQDEQLLALQIKYPEQYMYKSIDEDLKGITCYAHHRDNPNKQ